ncbi:transposase [Bifidobacterium animalis]|uniref:transposase n=1 Tax=Bifidobacterium animalis TaxID=28025 RepID=UPI0009B83E4A|nr:transposase [Bifidobacterium animalis]
MGGGRPGGGERGMLLLEQADRFSSVARSAWTSTCGATARSAPVRDRDRRPDPALRRQAARLLDMVPGRSAQVLRNGCRRAAASSQDASGWRHGRVRRLEAGRRIRRAHAVEVIDPFHVVQLAAPASPRCAAACNATPPAARCQGKGDRLYDCRRALLTSDEYLGARGRARLMALFAIQANRDLMLAHDAYQRVIHAYRCDDRRRGERMMRELIDDLTGPGRYKGCRELASLGRVLKRRMRDILALFRHPRSSNGPTEAINGRLETLRGNAMGFANTTSYIQRCLIHSSQLKDILTH